MEDCESYTFTIDSYGETFKSKKTYTSLKECIDASIYISYCKYGEDINYIYILKNGEIINKFRDDT